MNSQYANTCCSLATYSNFRESDLATSSNFHQSDLAVKYFPFSHLHLHTIGCLAIDVVSMVERHWPDLASGPAPPLLLKTLV